jgi:hypothetical protein
LQGKKNLIIVLLNDNTGYLAKEKIQMNKNVKRHLEGGSLRKVMAAEIVRVIRKYAGQSQSLEHAALELGVTARTLRIWRGPVEKGGWKELQQDTDKFYEAIEQESKKGKKKRSSKKPSYKFN